MTVWDEVLAHMAAAMDAEDFRRWFGATSYGSDSGDQVTVWVETEPIRRHLVTHFTEQIHRALGAVGRNGAHVRFVVSGAGEDEDDE